jgi:hypothetical protein
MQRNVVCSIFHVVKRVRPALSAAKEDKNAGQIVAVLSTKGNNHRSDRLIMYCVIHWML